MAPRPLASDPLAFGTLALGERPDVLILDHDPLETDAIIKLARAYRDYRSIVDVSIGLLTEKAPADLYCAALDAQIDDFLCPPFTDSKLKALLRPLVHISRMLRELKLRAAEASGFGVLAPDSVSRSISPDRHRILAVGENIDDYARYFPGSDVIIADNVYEARDIMEQNNTDAVVLIPGEGNLDDYLDLCRMTRKNPRLLNLPVLFLDQNEIFEEATAYSVGANYFTRPPFDQEELTDNLSFLVHVQKIRGDARNCLLKCLTPETCDKNTGVYSTAFLERYLNAHINAPYAKSRYLTVLALRIPDLHWIKQEHGREAAISVKKQVAQWVSKLVRVEDLVASGGETDFAIILTDTPMEQTQIVVNRIAGVINQTEFSAVDVFMPLRISAETGVSELGDAETAHALLQSAFDKLPS